MNAGKQEIKVKRVSSRKRTRESLLKRLLTPAKKGEGVCLEECSKNWRIGSIMADVKATEILKDHNFIFVRSFVQYCSDSEDLFGGYDSILEDSSLLAKLDNAEQNERRRDAQPSGDADAVAAPNFSSLLQPKQEIRTDSVLDSLGDESFEDLPPSQLQFQEQILENAKRRRLQEGDKTSTPKSTNGTGMESNSGGASRHTNIRRSMMDKLKRTMVCNAASPSSLSRTIMLKEAVVLEEISVAMQAMETVSDETTDLGPFFGLPTKVKDLLHSLRGIKNLYGIILAWQETCLNLECVQERKNLIYSLPTSGGKTLVAEILILRELLCRRKDCLFILPYITLVQEKLHMLGDGSRGAVIEMTLAKVLYVNKATQIIGMSATLGNIRDLQAFLRAENYTNDFRPVQLQEYVKLEDSIYEVDPKEENGFRFSRLLNFKYSSSMQKIDPDHIIALVTEVIPTHSCLVFCPTKKNCENVASMICRYLKEDFLKHREAEKSILLRELKESGNGSMCPVLRKTIPFGLAYHHSGLTSEERKLVEEAYSTGVLCLLTCTSTLAAGINLPARRVILRSPYVATDFLKRSQYKQMVGRAGRAGIDSVGESILILQDKDRKMARSLVCAPMENCYSNLMHDDGKGLLSLILSLIGLNIATSVDQMRDFLSGTLLYVQQEQLCADRSLWEVVQRCVQHLKDKGLVSVTELSQGHSLQVTKLGRATYKGSVDLAYSKVLYQDLTKGLDGLLLNSFLHLVYLVTPYDILSQCKPEWMTYLRQFSLLSPAEQRMSAAIGVPESFVVRQVAGQTVKKGVDMDVVKRMYLALVLFTLLKETNLWSVAEKFHLSRGFIQTLLSSSSAFCSCVLHFAEELEEFWPFKALLTELMRRLSYCVTAELIPLMEVVGVMESRAKQLYKAGYKTLSHLANADPAALSKTIENLYRKQAVQLVASARMLVNEKAAALQEEVDDLLMVPLDLPTP
uniref:Helicase, POLQ like n=1 Tax=Takifugu rubripes TaxID=31033 RepID=A0A674PQR1_TAKRU